MALLREGVDPVEAAVEGVTIVEDDPDDMSVGYGGLPNEHGVVQLDASVMHGPTHKAGAVAAIEDIRNPAKVALNVMKYTDHVLIVGEGAKEFALKFGFQEQEMLTEKARERWLQWKLRNSPNDDWLDPDQRDWARADDANPIEMTYGTIHCAARDEHGNMGAVTTTSGLSYKIPGRVGDSPIIGAGMYVENDIGAAGSTGRGEAVIQNCASFAVVQAMGRGLSPTEACLEALARIEKNTRQTRLRNGEGKPNFNVSMYALRADGAYGGASLRPGGSFAVHDGETNQRHRCVPLID